MHSKILLLVIVVIHSLQLLAHIPGGQKVELSSNWEFLKSDLGGCWEAVRPAAPESPESVPLWKSVSIPHCYNGLDAVDPTGNYYQGPTWYRTLLPIENPYADGRTLLHFEGVGQEAEVYVYTTLVKKHIGGYDEWSVDITAEVEQFIKNPLLKQQFKGKIPISVRVSNARNLERIPSAMSDFNLYGGIYRPLWMVYQPGIYFSRPAVEAIVKNKQRSTGLVNMILPIHNTASKGEHTSVSLKLISPGGKTVLQKTETQLVATGDTQLNISFDVNKVQLWSTDQPNLYQLVIEMHTAAATCTFTEKIGFRYFHFEKNGPFYLNGNRLLLRGTHRHEDHAGVGAAMTREQIEAEMRLIKKMGVNFIRLGHYQQSEQVLDLCDELGMVVWEEIPWCRGGLGGETYKQQAREMLRNMISQHRNHPSVLLWGLGNENDWPGDFPEFDKEKIRNFMKELHAYSHELDSTRLTSIRRCDFCSDIVDVYSPSIWAGWYRGKYTDYKSVSENEMKKVNHFLHVEWGGDSHAGRYSEHPLYGLDQVKSGSRADEQTGDATLRGGQPRVSKDGDWSESYMVGLFDWHLKEQEQMPWLTGTAAWVFKDFATPLRPENPIPYVNQKGVVERDLTPKESYYVFQSYWATEPMVHIYGHNWLVRWGLENEEKLFKVFSNCKKVELFLNGKSLGVRIRNSADYPAAGLHWEAVPVKGRNELKALAFTTTNRGKDTVLTDEISFEYQTEKWGEVSQIACRVDSVSASEVWVEAQLLDKNGVACLDARNYISFELVGDDVPVINQGTVRGSSRIQAQNGKARIKVNRRNGNSVVSVSSPRLKTRFVFIQ